MQLSISTATAACSVALIQRETLVAERHEVVGRGHAERLVPLIRDLVGSRQPDSILVDCGPGSFTGIRVGLAAARALALAWSIPVNGYSTLSLIAAGATSDAPTLGVAILGGHGELFVQDFTAHPLTQATGIASMPIDSAASFIASELVFGSGAEELVRARGYGSGLDALPRAANARLLPPTLRGLKPSAIYVRAPDASVA